MKFLRGADELRDADAAIAALKYGVEFPDDGPTRVVQRGILSCSKLRQDCTFVLYPATSTPVPRPTFRAESPSGE